MEEVEADTTVGTMEFTTPLSNFKKPASKPVTPKSGKLSTLPTVRLSLYTIRLPASFWECQNPICELMMTSLILTMTLKNFLKQRLLLL